MKIAHVIDSNGIYGAEVMVLHLMAEQQRMGQQPLLLSITDGEPSARPLDDAARERGLAVRSLRLERGFSLANARTLVRALREEDAGVVHCHGYKGTVLLAPLPRRLRGVPVIRTLHGWTSTSRFSRIWLYDMLDRLALARMDAVVDVHGAGRNPLVDRRPGPNGRIVIENGIPELPFRWQNVLQDLDMEFFSSSVFTVGAVSRLSAEKGMSTLLDALVLLRDGPQRFRAVIIGEGPEQKGLERRIADAGLSGTVLLVGYRSEAYRYLPLFDAFVLLSRTEGLPVTLLEAMQAMVPIVATPVGGIPRVLEQGDCGILVEYGNAGSLARALRAMQADPAATAERCRRARARVLEQYSSRRMAEDYQRVYEEVLGAGRVRHG